MHHHLLCLALLLAAALPASAQNFSPPSRVQAHPRAASQAASPPTRSRNADPWRQVFKSQVQRCWSRPDLRPEGPIQAIFSVKLARDGTLTEAHAVAISPEPPDAKAFQASGLRALLACQPYHLPDEAYEQWRWFEPVFSNIEP